MKQNENDFSFDNYDLNFEAAKEANLSIYEAEDSCKLRLFSHFKDYIFVWEYGFYFLSLAVRHIRLNKSYGIIASYHTEAMTSLRVAFLSNLYGYQTDSINTLRRVHDSAVRALYSRYKPEKMQTIVLNSSLQGFYQKLQMGYLKELFDVPSSFAHGNRMKVIKAWQEVLDDELKFIDYGCQIDLKKFSYSAKLSIFWLYFLIRVIPILFQDQVSQYWLDRQTESLRLLRDYLQVTKSSLAATCDQVEESLAKLDFSIARSKK